MPVSCPAQVPNATRSIPAISLPGLVVRGSSNSAWARMGVDLFFFQISLAETRHWTSIAKRNWLIKAGPRSRRFFRWVLDVLTERERVRIRTLVVIFRHAQTYLTVVVSIPWVSMSDTVYPPTVWNLCLIPSFLQRPHCHRSDVIRRLSHRHQPV